MHNMVSTSELVQNTSDSFTACHRESWAVVPFFSALISKAHLNFKIVIIKLISYVIYIYYIWNITKHSLNLKENISVISFVCQHSLILTFHQDLIYKLLWDCSCLNKNLLHEEQFSKEQMIAGLFCKDSGMNMNICNLSCCRIQSNLCTRKDNYILNLKSENWWL